MSDVWNAVKEVLSKHRLLEASKLNPGASPEEIRGLERHIGVQLPESLKKFLMAHNGQAEDGVQFFIEGMLLSTSRIRYQWDVWRSIDEDEGNKNAADQMSSEPPGCIKLLYSNRNWIPLTHDFSGNHVGIDFDPDIAGTKGQIISFGADEDEKKVFAASFEEFSQQMLRTITEADWSDFAEFRSAP
ncbi:SMI1/KNR4 family protein [Variovorax paradoxus]|uniref:SMI1/KNR4 family protein n=1 Tax=Variovorax paradoxus TaxID=34073 RepID=UPI003D647864